ncbi:helix-turn-helix domain-containing protein [Desulfocurvibacter africanus]|uniref:helix-turn-helix domain-containing protein n=1 Tax=Desulfocurvibacter africanus TaxID=873 RepID=UPI00059D833C|nr:helix-turn-helix transcriptional regulator [Desulfocurvibacter africanus]
MCEELNANSPSRQARLEAWFAQLKADHGMTKAAIARELEWHPQQLSMVLSGKRMTEQRHARLVAYGVPAELLPEPRPPRRRGPKRCSDCPGGSS